MPISPSADLANIAPGESMDITQVHGELTWIESRALDAGNASGDTMQGPLTTPGLVLGGVGVNTNAFFYFGPDTGLVNALAVTTSFPSAMAKGQVIAVKVANTNTAASTLNVNGLGAYSILQGGIALTGGELPASGWCLFEFDGTYWNVVGMAPGGNPNATIGANIVNAKIVNATTINATTWNGAWASMPATTESVFYQAAAPPGWTQNVSINDQVLRVVSGAGGGAGGNWGISGFSFAGHSHYFDHQHDAPVGGNGAQIDFFDAWGTGQGGINGTDGIGGGNLGNNNTAYRTSPISVNDSGIGGPNTGNTGGAVSNDGTWRPAYINVIVCSKN
ncbi:MAG: hypothetical protein M0041_03390 [Nitrospiraceae bacterium]|nr:hypothetical protein [Nitrospiraceae bacterium]